MLLHHTGRTGAGERQSKKGGEREGEREGDGRGEWETSEISDEGRNSDERETEISI